MPGKRPTALEGEQSDELPAPAPSGACADPVRDPRVDPRPQDELRGGKSTRMVGVRYVDQKYGDTVGFTYWRIGFEHGTGNDCYALIETWRKWAKDAEVLHVSPSLPLDSGRAGEGAER